MSVPRLADALMHAELVHGRDALDAAIATMADAIRVDYAEGEVALFVTVMHGGLPVAASLAFALGERGLDLEFDYLHATRYRGQMAFPAQPGCTGRDADARAPRGCWSTTSSRRTHLKAVRRWCEDQDAADVRVACLR